MVAIMATHGEQDRPPALDENSLVSVRPASQIEGPHMNDTVLGGDDLGTALTEEEMGQVVGGFDLAYALGYCIGFAVGLIATTTA
jgi:hypothetical protein